MQKILEFLVNDTENLQFKRIYEYLLNIRNQAQLGDYIFLTIGTFLVYYLFSFRLRLYFEYGTIPKKKSKHNKNKYKKCTNKEPTFFRWLYMLDSYSFDIYKINHPKLAKVTYVYNAITASAYICSVILIVPSFFSKIICNIFIDIVFVHIYINIIPMGIYNLIRFCIKKTSRNGSD